MEVIETERLLLRRPRAADAPAIFARYASHPEATRYLSWPTHRSLDDTHAFIAFSEFPNLRPGEPCDVFSYALVF